jgi:hypothetical protein
MSGASLPATKADGCAVACPGSRCEPRALRCETLARVTVRKAGARPDNAIFSASSPPSGATRPRAAARSAMSGASLPATEADASSTSCASLVASLAAGVRDLSRENSSAQCGYALSYAREEDSSR